MLRPQCQTVNVLALLKIVFLINPDGPSQTGDSDEIIQVCLPRPPRATVKSSKPNRKQKRRQQQQMLQQQGDIDSAEQQQPFSYSVKYFTWALSDEEDEDGSDDSECQTITLPLRQLKIAADPVQPEPLSVKKPSQKS
jgi:hypothetical protein